MLLATGHGCLKLTMSPAEAASPGARRYLGQDERMKGTPSHSSRLLGHSSLLQQITNDDVGNSSVLKQFTQGDYGPSKYFQNSAIAGLNVSPVGGLGVSLHRHLLDAFSTSPFMESMKSIGKGVISVDAWFSSPVIKARTNTMVSILETSNNNLLKFHPVYTALDDFSKSFGAQIASNYRYSLPNQFASTLGAVATNMAAPLTTAHSLETFKFSFLDSLDPDELRKWIEELDDDAELTEELDDGVTTDPFHQALIGTSARWASIAVVSLKWQYDISVEKLELYLTKTAVALLGMLIESLMTVYGSQGYVFGAFLLGAIAMVEPEKRRGLSKEAQAALDLRCPFCAAVPDMWCIITKGDSQGDDARNLHRKRYVATVVD